MKNYYYQVVSALTPTNKLCSGSVRADDMEDALLKSISRNKITIEDEYYDKESMLNGLVWRTYFMMGDKKVSLSVSPNPTEYRNRMET